jgi:hypothetical protein
VELVVADVLQGQLVWRAAVKGAEVGYRMHVAAARALGHVAQLHVVEHALPQRRDRLCRHGDLLSAGLPEPGDPDRRWKLVYDPKYSVKAPKVIKIILCNVTYIALLSHSLLSDLPRNYYQRTYHPDLSGISLVRGRELLALE